MGNTSHSYREEIIMNEHTINDAALEAEVKVVQDQLGLVLAASKITDEEAALAMEAMKKYLRRRLSDNISLDDVPNK